MRGFNLALGMGIILFVLWMVSEMVRPIQVSHAISLPLLKDSDYGGSNVNRYYFVAMQKMTLTRSDSGVWTPYVPNATAVSTAANYELTITGRDVQKVTLQLFNQTLVTSNPTKWEAIFQQSRYGELWSNTYPAQAKTYAVSANPAVSGLGTSTVTFKMDVTNIALTANIAPKITYKADGSISTYTYYFPVLITFDCNAYLYVEHRDLNGQLITSYPSTKTRLVVGVTYTIAPLTSKSQYTYTSYTRSTNSTQFGTLRVSGAPPSFTFSNTTSELRYQLFYRESAFVYVRHVVRDTSVANTSTFKQVEATTLTFTTLPGIITVSAKSQHGKFAGSAQSVLGYPEWSQATALTSQSVNYGSGTNFTYVTLFYEPIVTVRTIVASVYHVSPFVGGAEAVFSRGEMIGVQASVTAPPTGVSVTRIQAIMRLLGTNTFTDLGACKLSSGSADLRYSCSGTLWSEALFSAESGFHSIDVVADYSDGIQLSTRVLVKLEGSLLDGIGVHRLK